MQLKSSATENGPIEEAVRFQINDKKFCIPILARPRQKRLHINLENGDLDFGELVLNSESRRKVVTLQNVNREEVSFQIKAKESNSKTKFRIGLLVM